MLPVPSCVSGAAAEAGPEPTPLRWRALRTPVWALGGWELLLPLGILTPLLNCRVQDMNREVVKTDCATARIPELDFEIPAFTQKGGGYVPCTPRQLRLRTQSPVCWVK